MGDDKMIAFRLDDVQVHKLTWIAAQKPGKWRLTTFIRRIVDERINIECGDLYYEFAAKNPPVPRRIIPGTKRVSAQNIIGMRPLPERDATPEELRAAGIGIDPSLDEDDNHENEEEYDEAIHGPCPIYTPPT